VLKWTIKHLKRSSISGRRLNAAAQQTLAQADKLLERLACVQGETATDAISVPVIIRALPRSHRFYEYPLWIGYLIASGGSLRMESSENLAAPSFILPMAKLFEDYLAQVLDSVFGHLDPRYSVVKGDVAPSPLFIDNDEYTTHPDYLIKYDSQTVAIADAKYMPSVGAGHRYEVLAFCEAAGVVQGALVHPASSTSVPARYLGETIGGKQLHSFSIDLASDDIYGEEQRLVASMRSRMSLPLETENLVS
jgi:hypothetical protein